MRRTLNDFFETEGNVLITNNYNEFDNEILEIRMQSLYGERPLRCFTDSKITKMAQNVVDMYKDYLKELFTFPTEYKLLEPELKKIIRDMSYTKTNDNTNDVTNNGSSSISATGGETTSNDTTTNETVTTDYGKTINHLDEITTHKNNSANGQNDATHTGTVVTESSNTNGNTTTKNVSAYNQLEGYTPREQDVTNGNDSGTVTQTNNLVDNTTIKNTGEEDGTETRDLDETQGGKDTTTASGTQNDTGSLSTHNDTKTTSNDTSKTNYSGTETYDLKENTEEHGRLNYEEILNTIDNLFNPYDWLCSKIVNTICEVFYETKEKRSRYIF